MLFDFRDKKKNHLKLFKLLSFGEVIHPLTIGSFSIRNWKAGSECFFFLLISIL